MSFRPLAGIELLSTKMVGGGGYAILFPSPRGD